MEQRSHEWFEARKGRITASAVGAILGLSPYMNRADVMRNMVREAIGAEREFKGNIATDYGANNEAGAVTEYRIETLHDVQEVGFITRDDWAGCSPDGIIGDKGGVEIKCPFSLRKAEPPVPFKTLEEQPQYYAQVQFSLWVTQREWWQFYQWTPNGTKLEPQVLPDTDWQAENLPILRQFHAEFLHEVVNNADEHLAPLCAVVDTPDAHKMIAEWDEISEQAALLAERKADLLESIVSMAGGKNAEFAGRRVTQVERAGSVSWKKIVDEHLPNLDKRKYAGKATRYWTIR